MVVSNQDKNDKKAFCEIKSTDLEIVVLRFNSIDENTVIDKKKI